MDKKFGWIDIQKRRPPKTGVYLVCAFGVNHNLTKRRPCVALWDKGDWFLDNPAAVSGKILVTHWSFIPEPESEGADDE